MDKPYEECHYCKNKLVSDINATVYKLTLDFIGKSIEGETYKRHPVPNKEMIEFSSKIRSAPLDNPFLFCGEICLAGWVLFGEKNVIP